MRLVSAEIEGYRSIRERMTVYIEKNVTVVLGPNDHGKTNLLSALLHLNSDDGFDSETDLNWDSEDQSGSLPEVQGIFELSGDEREWLLAEENKYRGRVNARVLERSLEALDFATDAEVAPTATATPQKVPGPTANARDDDSEDDDADELPDAPLPQLTLRDVRAQVLLKRSGVNGELVCESDSRLEREVLESFAKEFAPRVELISPIAKLSDRVSAKELMEGTNEFMRGIFYYAGLDPSDSGDLFAQNDTTLRSLSKASAQLDTTLRETWSQGRDLHFKLQHDSEKKAIDLLIEDPSVDARYVRASRRSSGFTHYFALKTILHARQRDHNAASYILLFDEPGVFLHPSGQYDLLQVLETLALESQVIYATHSLFMINKTFPGRHRLIMKEEKGTVVHGKPYVGRWEAVLTALGLTLTGSILFANNVILTEGDSDPIYIYAIVQKAAAAGISKLDLNALAVMSTSESRHAEVLVRLLAETRPRPKIAMLTDGDKGGKERRKQLDPLITQHSVATKVLTEGTSIEDHIPMLREIYVPAVATYVASLVELQGRTKPDEDELLKKFDAHFQSANPEKTTKGVAGWAINASSEIADLKDAPSKVGIAREYARRLLEFPTEQFKLDTRSRVLLDWLHNQAGVPEMRPAEKAVIVRQSARTVGDAEA